MTTVFFRADLFHAPGLQAGETAAIERIDDALIAVEDGTITAVLRPDDPLRAPGGPVAAPTPVTDLRGQGVSCGREVLLRDCNSIRNDSSETSLVGSPRPPRWRQPATRI